MLAGEASRVILLIKNCSFRYHGGDNVWIHVRGWTTIFKVAFAFRLSVPSDSDGSTTVRHSPGESVHAGRLVFARQSSLIALAIGSNMRLVSLFQLLNRVLDHPEASFLPHALGAEVGVTSCTIPISFNRFGVQREYYSSNLCNPLKNITSRPKLISSGNSQSWPYLKLPLPGHDLPVDATDLNSCIQTGLVMSIDNITAPGLVYSYTAIVWSLRPWVAANGPTQRPLDFLLQQCIFLLEAIPWLFFTHFDLGKDFSRSSTFVGWNRLPLWSVAVADHQNVVTPSKWISEDCLRVENDFAVLAWRLACAGSIIVPSG
ncbi:hypothetical protein Mapa_000819 [Marchantia paleacea]|nr:hypothetical protein Mapa_000819 [Marchantia paleacea]